MQSDAVYPEIEWRCGLAAKLEQQLTDNMVLEWGT